MLMLKGHAGSVTDVSLSEDSKLIVTAGRDQTARIWRVADGAPLVALEGHGAALSSATLSPDGNYVVTTSAADHAVRLWDVASGREIATLADKQRIGKTDPLPVNAVFNTDGTRILLFSGGQDARIVRAFPNIRDLVEYAHSVIPRELSPCERKRFFLPVGGEVGNCEK
jgi:WD40 repeat protein